MKDILKIALFTFSIILYSSTTKAEDVLYLPIVEVYDGDTIKTTLQYQLPPPLNSIKIRIRGIDTPEMPAKSFESTNKLGRAKCYKEAETAILAKALVQSVVDTSKDNYMRVTNFTWGKYGGRIIADVSINDTDIGELLLRANYAVPYNGSGQKEDWCK